MKFKLKDKVRKVGGDYKYEGVVAGIVYKKSGQIRYVVEDVGDIQSAISLDKETQLKAEYNTVWADSTDGSISLSVCEINHCSSNCQNVCSSSIQGSFFAQRDEIKSTGNGCTTFTLSCGGRNDIYTENDIFIFEGFSSTGSGAGVFFDDNINVQFQGNGRGFLAFKETIPLGNEYVTLIDGVTTKYIPNTFDITQYTIERDGAVIGTTTYGSDIVLSFGGEIKIQFIGFKAQFACDLSSDEVWIQEQFAESFNRADLEFIPTKFCETRPAVLRRLDEGEKIIREEEGIDVLNTGGIVPASLTDLVTINYAAFFVEGVTSRCAENQANVKIGDVWVCKDVISPLSIIVQCEESADCPQPLKNLCPNYFQGCQNNFCVYNETILDSAVCKNEVITIIKDIEKINEREIVTVSGENVFPFSVSPFSSFDFGTKKLEGRSTFTCTITTEHEGILRFPNPNPDCYLGSISFDGQVFDFKDSAELNLKDNILVTYFAGGEQIVRVDSTTDEFGVVTRTLKEVVKKLSGTFVFTVNDPIDIQLSDSQEVLFNVSKDITLDVINNLFDGTVLLKVRQTAKISNKILPEVVTEHIVVAGSNNILFNLDTSTLGIQELEVQAFYKITVRGKDILMPSDKIIFSYNVVTELSGLGGTVEIVILEKEVEVIREVIVREETEIPTIVLVLGGIALLFIILRLLKVF